MNLRGLRLNVVAGALLVGLVAAAAAVSFVWTPHDPTHVVVSGRFLPPGQQSFPLGTDEYGRDVLSQLIVGARNTLFVGVVAVGIALLIGTPLGALAAIRRGWLEEVVMRASDVLFAFPAVLMAIMLGAAYGPGSTTAMVAIGLASVPVFARLTRGATLQVLELDFITAARTCGTSTPVILLRHVLPNVASVLIVQATIAFALAVLAEAALSYLGIGTQPPTPSWGKMLNEAQNYLTHQPLLALWPGLAIALTVLGLNLLGDGLRDTLDPRLAERMP